MKVLFFSEDTRKFRQAAMRFALRQDKPFSYGIRKPSEFDPENVEQADAAVIDGDFPAIAEAYPLHLQFQDGELVAQPDQEKLDQKSDAATRRKAARKQA